MRTATFGASLACALLAASAARPDPLVDPLLLDTPRFDGVDRTPFDVARIPGGAVIGTLSNGAINLQRRDAAGALVPGSFVGVAATLGRAASPAMGAYATGLWVVWTESRLTNDDPPERVLGVRVGFDLRVLDATPLELARAAGRPTGMACTASQCLVALGGGFVRVSDDGRLLDATVRSPGPVATLGLGRANVTTLGDRFVLAWQGPVAGGGNDVFLGRVAADGTLLDPGGRLFSAAGARRRAPTVASDGARLFVSWYADASGPRPTGQYSQLFDADLTPTSSLAVAPGLPSGNYVALWTGSQWFLYEPGGSGYCTRYASDGTALDMAPFTQRLPGLARALAAGGPVDALVYVSARGTWTWGRYATDGTAMGAATAVPMRWAIEREPYADSDGTDFIVGFTREDTPNVLLRVSATGAVSHLARPGAPRFPFAPTAATLEGDAVQLYGTVPGGGGSTARFTATSQTLGATTLLDNALGMYRVVRGPNQRMAFFTAGAGRGGANAVTRLSPAGARIDPNGIPIGGFRSVSAIFDGARYLTVYPVPNGGAVTAYARRISVDGDFIDVVPRAIGLPVGVRNGPALAYGAGVPMVAWIQTDGQVRAARLNADGSLRDMVSTPLGTSTEALNTELTDREIALVYDGASFVAVWSADRRERVLARRISPAGALLDPQPIVVSPGYRVRGAVFAAATNGAGTTLVASETYDPATGADRVMATFLRGGTVTPTDAGVTDVPAPQDVLTPSDVAMLPDIVAAPDVAAADVAAADVTAPVDVVASPDAAAPDAVVDAAVAMDVPAAPDAGPTTDLGALDRPAPQDVVTIMDAASADDATAVGDVATADARPAPTPPAEEAGCAVRAGSSRERGCGWWWALAAAAMARRRRRDQSSS